MAVSILKIGISQNVNCDNLVSFPKSVTHINYNNALATLLVYYFYRQINITCQTVQSF